jgi:hypothetical protein
MDEYVRKQIETLIGGIRCPKNFQCAANNFEKLCRAEDIGIDDHLVCLEPGPVKCLFAVPFGYGHFCRCPLRVFLAKRLRK